MLPSDTDENRMQLCEWNLRPIDINKVVISDRHLNRAGGKDRLADLLPERHYKHRARALYRYRAGRRAACGHVGCGPFG